MRTKSRVSLSKNQMRTYDKDSSVAAKRLLGLRAPLAMPRIRPCMRLKKLTSRSPSPRGKVRKTMASDSRTGIGVSARRLPGRSRRNQEPEIITTAALLAQTQSWLLLEIFGRKLLQRADIR